MLSVAHLVERVSCIKAESLLQRPGFDSSRTAMVCCMFSPPSLCPAVTLNKAEMAKKKKKNLEIKCFHHRFSCCCLQYKPHTLY